MDNPPSYEDSTKATGGALPAIDSKLSPKGQHIQQWNLQDELVASRAEHVAIAVDKVQSILQSRAQSGISSTTLIIVPSGQILASIDSGHELVGFQDGEKPVIAALKGETDGIEFWSQTQAILELDKQLHSVLCIPYRPGIDQSLEKQGPPARDLGKFKGPFAARKSYKLAFSSSSVPVTSLSKPIQIRMSEVYFRTETPFGLFETIALQAIVIKVIL